MQNHDLAAALAAAFAVAIGAGAARAAGPDLTGVYMMKGGRDNPVTSPYKLTPEGEKAFARNKVGVETSDPEVDVSLKCLSTGLPRMLFGPLPFALLQTPKMIAVVSETDPVPRVIYVGRPHRKDYWPTFMGDSTGRWDGDTLVVDTVKLNTATFVGMTGLPHSDALHIVERMRLIDDGKALQDIVTVEDPKMYAAPWTMTYRYDRHDELQPVETVCENPRDKP